MTVLVRDPAKLPADHKACRVVVGDVTNKEDVKKTMEGQDAAIIILGTRNDLSKPPPQSEGGQVSYVNRGWRHITLAKICTQKSNVPKI